MAAQPAECGAVMTFLILLLTIAAVAAGGVGLANYWANTAHGRIRPIFAFAFKMQGIFQPKTLEGALAMEPMNTPEERAKVRADFAKNVAPMSKPTAFDGTIEDRVLDGPGGKFSIRVYTPPGSGPFPLMVYLHGGGFIVGTPDYTDDATRTIASLAPAVVVSVDYRLSPEVRYPGAIEDCEFAIKWCIENSSELKIKPGPIAVGGDSAGGNLAAVLSQRDQASGRNQIGLQVLIYPAVDWSRRDRESQIAFARGFGLSLQDIANCFEYYAPEGADARDPGLSPIFASSLAGQPRALVFTAGFDVLRDEGTEYAELLEKAGVEVEHIREPHVPHGYITMTRLCKEAGDSLERIAGEVSRLSA